MPATIDQWRRWHLLPDGLGAADNPVVVNFASDPTAVSPSIRLRSTGAETPLRPTDTIDVWTGQLDLRDAKAGFDNIDVVERLRGGVVVVMNKPIIVSAAEYVVWTLDFEGDAASDTAMANTADVADVQKIPMTVMWNPRVWTTTQVTTERADAMLAWTRGRIAKRDELALHLHMWTDFVRAAGIAPRTAPSWAGRGDGYDVPITAYDESETRTLLDFSLRLMSEHQLPRPTTFRAGGQFANAATLSALRATGFVADCSAVPAGTFGRLRYPWTLAADAQPYFASVFDANVAGAPGLLEAPTIGGNTYGYDTRTIQSIIRADLSYLASVGQPAPARRAITIVSHPGTVDQTEHDALIALFNAFAPLRYDLDEGPVRFITLAQLAKIWP